MHKILITGAAGYVGAMLVNEFSKRKDVEAIFGVDREPIPDFIKDNKKLTYLQTSVEYKMWQEKAKEFAPNIVIHTAWAIREVYDRREITWQGNIIGSDNVFAFSFLTPSVKKLIHFSTVASYGAFEDNSVDHFFTEDEPFRKSEYLYAEEKRIAEERLQIAYQASDKSVQVTVLRPAAITGPRGRYMRIRFGLQSALSGTLKGQKSFVYNIISALVSWVPVTPKWLRQYVHEDDVTDIVAEAAFNNHSYVYEEFNLAPPGEAVRGLDMAKAVGKKTINVKPWMIRIVFAIVWHLTLGKIPTAKGSWRGYSYPIAVSGAKVTEKLGYKYKHESLEAFSKTEGRYESFIPDDFKSEKLKIA